MKSSLADRSFAAFVRRALAAVRDEVPWAHEGVVRALGLASTTMLVDGELATVRAAGDDAEVEAVDDGTAGTRCVATTRTILDLVTGRESLLDAIEAERVHLAGNTEALLGWLDALACFLHGAVRAQAFDALLDEFKARATALENGAQ